MVPAPASRQAATDDRLVFRPAAGPAGDVLVTIFLRGGMDAVYTVPPFADRAFYKQRKGFGLADPGPEGLISLDGFFGLHPDFWRLESLYRRNLLAIVHAVGLSEPLLSHFDAMRAIEQGNSSGGLEDGWIGRHLTATQPRHPSPLRAVALGGVVPQVLRGSEARVLDSLADFRLEIPADWNPDFSLALRTLYARGTDLASVAGRGTLDTLAMLERLAKSTYQPEHGAEYPPVVFGKHLQQVAQLIKAEVGLEAAVLSTQGWDTHVSQVDSLGGPMRSLAKGLESFTRDLGDRMRRVVVVVISEFGRRVVPNMAHGTDHGRATAMFILGGGIRGGQVYGRWPGIATDELDEQGHLRVTTDFRHVLAEIIQRRLKNPALDKVFPNFKPRFLEFTT